VSKFYRYTRRTLQVMPVQKLRQLLSETKQSCELDTDENSIQCLSSLRCGADSVFVLSGMLHMPLVIRRRSRAICSPLQPSFPFNMYYEMAADACKLPTLQVQHS
jgi:hypothetical protein